MGLSRTYSHFSNFRCLHCRLFKCNHSKTFIKLHEMFLICNIGRASKWKQRLKLVRSDSFKAKHRKCNIIITDNLDPNKHLHFRWHLVGEWYGGLVLEQQHHLHWKFWWAIQFAQPWHHSLKCGGWHRAAQSWQCLH